MIIKFHSKMKALFVLTFLAAISYSVQDMASEEFTNKVKNVQTKCRDEYSNIPEEEYQKIVNKEKLPSTRDEKCFSFCYSKGLGYMQTDNKMSLPLLKVSNKQKYQPNNLAKADQVVETCVAEANKETDPCETAGTYFSCLWKQSELVGLQLPSYYKPS